MPFLDLETFDQQPDGCLLLVEATDAYRVAGSRPWRYAFKQIGTCDIGTGTASFFPEQFRNKLWWKAGYYVSFRFSWVHYAGTRGAPKIVEVQAV